MFSNNFTHKSWSPSLIFFKEKKMMIFTKGQKILEAIKGVVNSSINERKKKKIPTGPH